MDSCPSKFKLVDTLANVRFRDRRQAGVDPEQPVVRERSGRSRTDGPLALEPSVSHAAKAERQC
jgi:hypothetical protein